jgi:hypothetical protein
LFEIIQGESPKALPLTYENTKFPSIDDKVKQMMADRDEALAAHELAQTRRKYVYSVYHWTQSLVGHPKHENELP